MKKVRMKMTRVNELTYQDLFEEFIRHKKIIGLAQETINAYTYNHKYLNRFIDLENTMLDEIEPTELINDYIAYLQETRDIKSITICTYIRHIVPVLKYGVTKGYFEDFQATYPKYDEIVKDIYTDWELKTLLVKPKSSSFAEYRNWVLINFLLGTGVRAKELRNIQLKHLHLEQGVVLLNTTKSKKPRYLPLSTSLVSVLENYLKYRGGEENEYLFCTIYGEMIQRVTLQNAIKIYALKRGVSRFSLHLFRHTFATRYIANGGSPLKLKKILGHKTMKMVDHYVSLNNKDLIDDIDEYNPLEKIIKKDRIKLNK